MSQQVSVSVSVTNWCFGQKIWTDREISDRKQFHNVSYRYDTVTVQIIRS